MAGNAFDLRFQIDDPPRLIDVSKTIERRNDGCRLAFGQLDVNGRRKFPGYGGIGNTQIFFQPLFDAGCRQLDDVDVGISAGGAVNIVKGHVFIAVDDDRAKGNRCQPQEQPQDKDTEDA